MRVVAVDDGEFGAVLRRHRLAAGLTQEELADRAALSVRTVSALECGRTTRPFRHSVRSLAIALGLAGAAAEQFAAAARPRLASAPVRVPAAAEHGSAESALVPRQLPAPVPHFTGRARELAALDERLAQAGGSAVSTMVISAIGGTAGVGKTALAVQWAHRHADRFPDGQLFLNLRGFDPSATPVSAAAALRCLLDAFAVPAARIPVGIDAQVGLYRSVLAGRRVLIVLDNARDCDQVRPLLPGAAGCLVMVTSRNRLADLVALDGAVPVTIDLLSLEEAGQLLARRLSPARVGREPRATGELIDLSARLPLALNIVASRALAQPNRSLGDLAADLAGARRRLDPLSTGTGGGNLRAVLSWSYQSLGDTAAHMFRVLGMHPGPHISVAAAASLAAARPEQARQALSELTAAHLLTEPRPGWYSSHDLLRAYAIEHNDGEDPSPALPRLLDHYLHTARRAMLLLFPARDPVALPAPRAGTVVGDIETTLEALAWFDAERPALIAAAALAATAGYDSHAWQIPSSVAAYLERRGNWVEYADIQTIALAAAERAGDLAGQANACCLLGRAYSRVGRGLAAYTHLIRALDLYRALADLAGQAHAHHSLGWTFGQQARYAEALEHARQALDLYQAAGHTTGQARALNTVGWYGSLLGLHREALDYCRRSLDLHRELGNHDGEADAWDSLAHAYHHLGQHTEAIACYLRAIDLFEQLGDRYQRADTLGRLADAYTAVGDHAAAEHACQRAIVSLDDLDDPDVDLLRARLRHACRRPAPLSG